MDPNTHILGVKTVGLQAKIVLTSNSDSEVSLLCPLWTMNSNLMILPPFIISMRHWISQAAVMRLYGSKHTHSWFERECGASSQNRPHQQLSSQLVETIVDNEFQSHDSPTIYHIHDEILDQSSCCDMAMAVWIQILTFHILGVGVKSFGLITSWQLLWLIILIC